MPASARQRAWQRANPEKVRAYRRAWKERHPEKARSVALANCRARDARYRATHPKRLTRALPIETRFLAGLRRQANGCVFFGSGRPDTYGRLNLDGRVITASRFAWSFYEGPIPPGMCVLHRCDTPRCVARPHLFLGTKGDNSRDMIAKGRGRGQFA